MQTTVFRARFAFPVDGPPLEDAAVLVQGERIVAIGRDLGADQVVDLGNSAILPGLVNAHTHLEFSDLAQPLGRPGMALPDWIREVIQYRRMGDRPVDAVARGLLESANAGTTMLAEIAQPGWPGACFRNAPLDAVVFLELLALAKDRADLKLQNAREHLLAGRNEPGSRTEQAPHGGPLHLGLSPHAPYTVRSDLMRRAVSLAQQYTAPLAIHLAESREELALLSSGGGPFRQLFEDLGVWTEGAISPGSRPLDTLRQLAAAPCTLVVHGNYLDDEELGFLAASADRMALVYCPRTHAYFGHQKHPWQRLLAWGGTVAIGTDSRASNPDLSVLAELRFLAARGGNVDPAVLLELGTRGGARALGLQDQAGSLSVGKLANLTIVPLPEHRAADPHELLLASELQPTATVWRGHYRATASCSSALRTPT